VPYGDFIPQKALIVDQSDVVQFVSSCLGRSILRNMQLHCQKLPITVRCSVPHTFHLLIFGGMTCTYTTEDAFPAVFASCMRKQFEHDGGYAVLKSPMDVTFDLDCQSTRVSFKYSVYNQAGTLQWPLTFVVPKVKFGFDLVCYCFCFCFGFGFGFGCGFGFDLDLDLDFEHILRNNYAQPRSAHVYAHWNLF
jgi:hypothetical protein